MRTRRGGRECWEAWDAGGQRWEETAARPLFASVLRRTHLSPTTTTTNPPSPPFTHTHIKGSFPNYRTLLYCAGNINLENRPVDACIDGGTSCDGVAAASAFCSVLGYDGAVGEFVKVEASPAPARSMTGEWCVAGGKYETLPSQSVHRSQWDELTAAYDAAGGKGCQRLAAVVCYRSREAMGKAWEAAGAKAKAVAAAAAAPAPSDELTVQSAGVASGGRRLLASA